MDRTASYFIIITRSHDGYIASSPAFPQLEARGSSVRMAYARLKVLLKSHIIRLLASGLAPPRDPVIQSRTIRLDLWYLKGKEELI